ncbi:SAF domain-containing protein [Paenibacillus athensensis]|uniref:SAF domain-containing protein n=1 Tax=Paenibacillus athensensis TaxID=1967502 RepID=A0A4Y8Q7D1_9BACL|nr:SAF domain-containing protein [Paenibacillus athensensis]MCD1257369.1 SAF domain-containing protein [Paenibacillus athensensis]
MNMEWNWKTIGVLVAIVLLFIGTNVGQYFLLWGPKQKEMKAAYDQQVKTLQATIDRIGPLVGIWTVKDGVTNMQAGKQVEESDLTIREIPESMITKSFILDPSSIVGKYYRIALGPGTPLSEDLVMEDPVDDTTREYDVVANTLPIGLHVGDYIDYRIVYPYGEDYIVFSHKRIEAINGETFKLKLNEKEIHYYQAALVDYFLQKQNGSIIYAAKYLEPGLQKPATQYYAIPKNIAAIITADPNIVQKVNAQLNDPTRTMIDSGVAALKDDEAGKLAGGRGEVIGKINGGVSEHTGAEEKRKQEAQAQAATQPPAASSPEQTTPVTPQSSQQTGTGATSAGSTTNNSGVAPEMPLNIGKGVVE